MSYPAMRLALIERDYWLDEEGAALVRRTPDGDFYQVLQLADGSVAAITPTGAYTLAKLKAALASVKRMLSATREPKTGEVWELDLLFGRQRALVRDTPAGGVEFALADGRTLRVSDLAIRGRTLLMEACA